MHSKKTNYGGQENGMGRLERRPVSTVVRSDDIMAEYKCSITAFKAASSLKYWAANIRLGGTVCPLQLPLHDRPSMSSAPLF